MPLRPLARYLYDLRWVTLPWRSIYGHHDVDVTGSTSTASAPFVQLWAVLPQQCNTLAHLLQQGAVLNTSFQPFEAGTKNLEPMSSAGKQQRRVEQRDGGVRERTRWDAFGALPEVMRKTCGTKRCRSIRALKSLETLKAKANLHASRPPIGNGTVTSNRR